MADDTIYNGVWDDRDPNERVHTAILHAEVHDTIRERVEAGKSYVSVNQIDTDASNKRIGRYLATLADLGVLEPWNPNTRNGVTYYINTDALDEMNTDP